MEKLKVRAVLHFNMERIQIWTLDFLLIDHVYSLSTRYVVQKLPILKHFRSFLQAQATHSEDIENDNILPSHQSTPKFLFTINFSSSPMLLNLQISRILPIFCLQNWKRICSVWPFTETFWINWNVVRKWQPFLSRVTRWYDTDKIRSLEYQKKQRTKKNYSCACTDT